jgi:hypothetical protein
MNRECSSDEEGKGVQSVLIGKPEGKSHWGDPGVDGRIIL